MKIKANLFITVLVFVLAACGTNNTENAAQDTDAEITEITVQLKWLHNPQFAGFYIADREGYYQEEGLNVTLVPNGPGALFMESVLNGDSQFGLASGQEIIQSNIDGQSLVSLGATYQLNPFVYMALRDEDGNDPIQIADDWRGEAVVHPEGDLLLFGILSTFGLTFDDTVYVADTFSVAPLVEGEAKVLGGFITDRGRVLIEQGFDVQFLRPEDFDVLTYEDLVYTTDEYRNANPDIVAAFMRATLRGWQFALENEDDVISAVIAFDSSQSPEEVTAVWRATQPLLGDSETLLQMNEAAFESTQSLMLTLDLISETRDASSYFTNDYLTSSE